MQLSPHFSLQELCHSDVALRRGIGNEPNAGEISNLERLCDIALEPARALLGVPLTVNSGYRSPALNYAIGGAAGSAHLDGRAVDFVPQGAPIQVCFEKIRQSSIPYDQIILECGAWIHIAIAKVGSDPRRDALTASGGPGKWAYMRVQG